MLHALPARGMIRPVVVRVLLGKPVIDVHVGAKIRIGPIAAGERPLKLRAPNDGNAVFRDREIGPATWAGKMLRRRRDAAGIDRSVLPSQTAVPAKGAA
jgi:hypothetical protein